VLNIYLLQTNNKDLQEGIDALIAKIEGDIRFHNWMYPDTTITMEDIINHLNYMGKAKTLDND